MMWKIRTLILAPMLATTMLAAPSVAMAQNDTPALQRELIATLRPAMHAVLAHADLEPAQEAAFDDLLRRAVQRAATVARARPAAVKRFARGFSARKIDRAAVERLRRLAVARLGRASHYLTDLALEAVEILTPAQRRKLATWAEEGLY